MDYRLASVACVRTAVAALDFLTDGTSVFAYNGPTGNLIETRTKVHANVKATIGSSTIPAGDYLLVLRTAYDKDGRMIATSDPFLAKAISYLTDPNDLLSNVKSDATIVTPQADLRLTHTIYDPLGRVVETRRLAGAAITMTTVTPQGSSAEFPVTEFDPPSVPDILTASITEYADDGLVKLTKSQIFNNGGTTPSEELITWFHYDVALRQIATVQVVDLNQDLCLDTGALAALEPWGHRFIGPDGQDITWVIDGLHIDAGENFGNLGRLKKLELRRVLARH